MGISVRIRGWWDDLRDSLWMLPSVGVLSSAVLASALVALEPLPSFVPDRLVYGGTPEGARAVLGELAGATITVTGLVFSLTVVALQVASSQFTPRLLRTFLRDRRTQLIMSGLLGSAVYHVAVLRTVRASGDGVDVFVPQLGVTFALLYALVATGLLIFFLHHVTRHLRVDVVMRQAAQQTIARLAGEAGGDLPDLEPVEPPDGAVLVVARVDGFLQTVDLERLGSRARRAGVRVRLRPSIGTWVTRGTLLAWWWDADPEPTHTATARAEVDDLVHACLHLGPDRTESDDVAFGIRQLADIGVRALSPGVNDPTTAVQAIEQLTAVLGAAARHPLGAVRTEDPDGTVRACLPRPTFAALLALAVDQLRSYGRGDTDVVVGLLALTTDLAELVADDGARTDAVRSQVERIAASASFEDDGDRARIERAVGRARAALGATRPPSVTEAG